MRDQLFLFGDNRNSTISLDATAPKSAAKDGRVIHGDSLEQLRLLPDSLAQCCVTSPPYWGLRDYGIPGQIGAENSPDEYVNKLTKVFREVRRVLADDGTLWLNIGDGYTSGGRAWRDPDKKNPARGMDYRPPTPDGLKPKDLLGIPWRLAFALQADGWYLRLDIIWHKPNAQPESVKDRPSRTHEYVFLFSKQEQYYYEANAVAEVGVNGQNRNRRSVWSINTQPYTGAHFATFPPELVALCVLAGSRPGTIVLDPFLGSGTVAEVASKLGRPFVGIELNPDYIELAHRRLMIEL